MPTAKIELLVDEVVDLYASGKTVREIAKYFGCGPSTIWRLLHSTGVVLRSSNKCIVNFADVVRLYTEGQSIEAIAKLLHTEQRKVSNHLKKFSIVIKCGRRAVTYNGIRRCARCKNRKPLDQFHNAVKQIDGKTAYCKTCQVQYTKEMSLDHRRDIGRRGAKKWRDNNLEVARQSARDWRRANRIWVREYKRISYARLRASGSLTTEQWQSIWAMWDGLCAYCGKVAQSIDHFISVNGGGPTSETNVVPACNWCNSSKGDTNPYEWMLKHNIPSAPILQKMFSGDLVKALGIAA